MEATMPSRMTNDDWCQTILPQWAQHAVVKIAEVLDGLAPDDEAAFALLLTLVHAAQTRYFSDGDCQAASLELADMFTGLADKIDAQRRRH
jgi:hypothetical protein